MKNTLRARPIVDRAPDLLVNGRLRLSRGTPRNWDVRFHDCDLTILDSSPTGMCVAATGRGHVELGQSVQARSNRRYRLDIRAETAPRAAREGPAGCIQARFTSLTGDEEIRVYEPAAMRIGGGAERIHRVIVQCPPRTRRLQVRLRIGADRPIVIRRIRLVETGDCLLTSHILANTPPPAKEPPPVLPTRVLFCDGRRDDRPLLRWLREVFGEGCVRRSPPSRLADTVAASLAAASGRRDPPGRRVGSPPPRTAAAATTAPPAIVLDLPEYDGLSLADLLSWSDGTLVIASLTTFAGAAGRAGIRGIRCQDRISGVDMPCGRIVLAGHHTRGYALADAIPYAWNDGQDDFAHRYLTMPKETKAMLAERDLRPSIVTECGRRDLDNRPLTLYRPGRRGALLVMDPDGLEAPSAGEDLPRTFDLLWRNALGRPASTVGQYAAPPTHYEGMMADLVEVAKHYDPIEDVSILPRVRGKAHMPPIWRLPAGRVDRFAARPTLLIRTGFAESDWPAVHGLIAWLKRLALATFRGEPAADGLLRRVRILAWPLTEPRNWRGSPREITAPGSHLPSQDLWGRIDLRVGPDPHTTILVPDEDAAIGTRRAVGDDTVRVRVDPAAFEGLGTAPNRRRPMGCTVLLPGNPPPCPSNSPLLTGMAATLLDRLTRPEQAIAVDPSPGTGARDVTVRNG